MAKVIAFPQKKRLPKGLEERVYEIAKEYVEVLYTSLILLVGEEYTIEDLSEVSEMVAMTYAEGLSKAIDDMEKG